MSFNDTLALCRQRLPLPELWRRLGLHGEPRKCMKSPLRADANESFSVFQVDGRWYFKDHNPTWGNHCGDEVTLIEIVKQLSNTEAIALYHELAGVVRGMPGYDSFPGVVAKASTRVGVDTAHRTSGTKNGNDGSSIKRKRSDYKPDWTSLGQIGTIYEYLDAEGEVLHQTIRFEPKNFRQRRRPVGDESPASDGWVYFLEGIEPILYRLPEILAADDQTPIFLVEGEKDAETIRSLGLLSTTVPMGAGKWRESYTKTLLGKWVVIIGDADEAGNKHLAKVCETLHGKAGRVGAFSIKEKWEDCEPKADITDWLEHCSARPEVLGLGDECESSDVNGAAREKLLAWADEAKTPEGIRYGHCFFRGERGSYRINQEALSEVLTSERPVKFAGEVWWTFEKARWKQMQVQRDTKRWIMDAVKSAPEWAREISSYMISSVEDLMANRVAMHPDRFNSHDPHLINVQNGMLDIRNLTLVPHHPKYLSTVQLPHRFDPNAKCPLFLKWLGEMLPATDTQELIQEIYGYCLAPALNFHKFFFFYGDGGTGKSTCIDVLTCLIGTDNTIAIRLQDLDNAFVRAQLVGRRLYLATELNRDSFKHIDLVKAITSGDPIHVEKKHRDGYTYRPQGRFIMASNVRAATGDTTDGFFRRLCQVTFENKIAESQKDYQLIEKFKAEMDGILYWSLQGLQRLMERGRFLVTEDSQKAAEMIQMHRASAKAFYERCVEPANDPENVLTSEALYEEYKQWCEWEHVKPHFENALSLSRELLNRIPELREKRVQSTVSDAEGRKARRMGYKGLILGDWQARAGIGA